MTSVHVLRDSVELLPYKQKFLILPNVGTFLCFYPLNPLAGPTYATFVTDLIPINGESWGAVFLGEQITTNSIIALGIILLGLAVVNNLIPLPKPFTTVSS